MDAKLFQINRENFIASDFGDEMIILDLKSGDYYNLNSVSSFIWKLLETTDLSANEIVERLIDEYEVDKDVCRTETCICIEDMVTKTLLLEKS